MEPPKKLTRTEDLKLKEMICSMQDVFFSKLKNIEEKIDNISSKYLMLEKKVDNIISTLQCSSGISSTSSSDNYSEVEDFLVYTEKDFPDGSWLGDPNNPAARIRCPITPKDLEHINNTCATAEKMSLTLLDYLFPREVQACSNLSGSGKHKKKQLDPCKIEGIKCHVTYVFGITESDWNRIKLNIDSKCRTAFRRKLKGMPLNVGGEKGRTFYKCKRKAGESDQIYLSGFHDIFHSSNEVVDVQDNQMSKSDEENSLTQIIPVTINTVNSIKFSIPPESEVMHSGHPVVQITKEQLEILKQNPNIEVLHQPILSS